MSHRAVATVLRLVLAFFAASALVFALAVRGPAPSGQAMPPTHRGFGEGTCASCHRVAPAPPSRASPPASP